MPTFSGQRRVIIRQCETYSLEHIKSIIREGIEALGIVPAGKILITPNIVTANKGYIHHSFTEPAMLESMVAVLRSRFGQKR